MEGLSVDFSPSPLTDGAWKQELSQGIRDTGVPKFKMPPKGIVAKDFVETHFGKGAHASKQALKGTTTLAFLYNPKTPQDKGGVVFASDSRATGGSYIASSSINKLLDITDTVVATMAGGAADCQFWISLLSREIKNLELIERDEASVAKVARLLSNILFDYRNYELGVNTLIGGVDKSGPSIYELRSDDGSILKGNVFSQGSGMFHALSILEASYGKMSVVPAMSDAEAVELARSAICHATFRDKGSGGSVNLVHIKNGEKKRRLERIDVMDFLGNQLKDHFEMKTPV